jgi:exopolyphosphatase/guanosine-5'-triphosphate,3'-diphosphate pyrophosphatase
VCHARQAVNPASLVLARSGDVAELEVPESWTDSHPRTLYLLDEETAVWERSGVLQLIVRR